MRGVFNMDMISRQPDGAIRLDGGPTGKVLVDLLVRLAPSVPIEMKVDTHPDWLQRSDQGSFLAAVLSPRFGRMVYLRWSCWWEESQRGIMWWRPRARFCCSDPRAEAEDLEGFNDEISTFTSA